jgi:hypothetical protein
MTSISSLITDQRKTHIKEFSAISTNVERKIQKLNFWTNIT